MKKKQYLETFLRVYSLRFEWFCPGWIRCTSSVKTAWWRRCQDSSAAFPHDLKQEVADYIVDETDCEVLES
jgi:hypothetical protein